MGGFYTIVEISYIHKRLFGNVGIKSEHDEGTYTYSTRIDLYQKFRIICLRFLSLAVMRIEICVLLVLLSSPFICKHVQYVYVNY